MCSLQAPQVLTRSGVCILGFRHSTKTAAELMQPAREHLVSSVNFHFTGRDCDLWCQSVGLTLASTTLGIGHNNCEIWQENCQGKENPHPDTGGNYPQHDADGSYCHGYRVANHPLFSLLFRREFKRCHALPLCQYSSLG